MKKELKKINKEKRQEHDERWFQSIQEGQIQILKMLIKHPGLTFDEILSLLKMEFHDVSLAFLTLVDKKCIRIKKDKLYVSSGINKAMNEGLLNDLLSWKPKVNCMGNLE